MMKLCGIALLAAATSIILGEFKSPLSKIVSAASALFLALAAVAAVSPTVSEFLTLFSDSELSVYTNTLLRALGIAYATELTSEICRTCGAESAAVAISVAGRAELAVIAAGFLFELLSFSLSLL